MDFEAQVVLVVEIAVSVAAIFLKGCVIGGTVATLLFGFRIDEGTGELLPVRALVFVEPSAAIGHFQVGFTEQIAVFRDVLTGTTRVRVPSSRCLKDTRRMKESGRQHRKFSRCAFASPPF